MKHDDHPHAATSAARARCRRLNSDHIDGLHRDELLPGCPNCDELIEWDPRPFSRLDSLERYPRTDALRNIAAPHCELCGSTEPDDIGDFFNPNDGYSFCCNEPVRTLGCDRFCNHPR